MSVIGVDFGTQYSTLAITRNHGVDIISNEVSKRETATYVSYTDQDRFIGERGLDRYIRNYRNTVACIKNWIGKRITDEDVEFEKRFISCPIVADANGKVQFEVQYNGDAITLYPEQVLAAFLQQLKGYVNREASASDKTVAIDCVLTVPCTYTAEQRTLVMQACEMAGMHCMSVINETSAASIDYGIFRGTTLPDSTADAQVVAIVDVGYGSTTVHVASFTKTETRVLARERDTTISTREIDYLLTGLVAHQIEKKHHVSIMDNARARLRVMLAVDKVKQMLSANLVAPLNIENLFDIDVNMMVQRSELEELCASMLQRLQALCRRVVERSGVAASKLHSVEVIGGGCRVPCIKAALEAAFERPPSFTLNASESTARGAAIVAAALSPKFQVRPYVLHEKATYPLSLAYFDPAAQAVSSLPFLPEVNKVKALLTEGDAYPRTVDVTIPLATEFTLFVVVDAEQAGGAQIVGEWLIGAPTKQPTNKQVVVQIGILPSGLLAINHASTMELYDAEVTEKDPEDPQKEIKVTKNKKRKLDLAVTSRRKLGLQSDGLSAAKKLESSMHDRDISIIKTKEAHNNLEGYILEYRQQLSEGGSLRAFVTTAQAAEFFSLATKYEEWLMDEGSDSTLSNYHDRLDKLTAIGAPAKRRYRLFEDAPFAVKTFVSKVKISKDLATAMLGKGGHITDEELQGAVKACDEAIAWAEGSLSSLLAAPKTEDFVGFALTQLDSRAKEVHEVVRRVVQKPAPPPPKPKAETPPPQEAPKDATDGQPSTSTTADDTAPAEGAKS